MHISLSVAELKNYMCKQLEHFFPDGNAFQGNDVDIAFELALQRLEYCFQYISLPAYSDENGNTFFSHLHSDQYSQFIYYLSNSLWEVSANKILCDKLINLNKALNGLFFSYKGKLPDIFLFIHPIGTVLGNAVYNNFLVVLQNVTVNTAEAEDGSAAPVLGKGLFLATGAKIIGNQPIGDGVSIETNTVVYKKKIENNQVVYTDKSGEIIIKNRTKENCVAQRFFRVDIMNFKN